MRRRTKVERGVDELLSPPPRRGRWATALLVGIVLVGGLIALNYGAAGDPELVPEGTDGEVVPEVTEAEPVRDESAEYEEGAEPVASPQVPVSIPDEGGDASRIRALTSMLRPEDARARLNSNLEAGRERVESLRRLGENCREQKDQIFSGAGQDAGSDKDGWTGKESEDEDER